MNRDRDQGGELGGGGGGGAGGGEAYNLDNIYRPLFTTRNQSSGKHSKSHDVTRSSFFGICLMNLWNN